MIATLVIGLREGLEAALIVGIIAAFLRKNGHRLAPMWIGVSIAIALSIGVGVALRLVERDLPQAKQEAMETVIGAVAIFFVTGMIVWMNTHSRGMKKELEAEAAHALSQGSAYSLAIMAFLAVLKEGFETSVFLLATFSAAQSARLATAGAVIGVLIAVIIGWGIYAGGVKINLAKFFRFTGAFLILVAAGLTVTMLRTAHEAGWITAGQQKTINLDWLVRPGTVPSALITGVLGIPADPRLIEVLGWLAYLIPVALYVYWPAKRRPKGMRVAQLQFGATAALVIAAAVLFMAYPTARAGSMNTATIVSTDASAQSLGTAQLVLSSGQPTALSVTLNGEDALSIPLTADTAAANEYNGIPATVWTIPGSSAPATASQTLTLDELAKLNGGRIPIGINPSEHPGPFTVDESTTSTTTVWVAKGVLLSASSSSSSIAKISGSGLTSPRTISVPADGSSNWTLSSNDMADASARLNTLINNHTERRFWARDIPVALLIAALAFAIAGLRTLRRFRSTGIAETAVAPATTSSEASARRPATDFHARSDSFAAH